MLGQWLVFDTIIKKSIDVRHLLSNSHQQHHSYGIKGEIT